MVCSACSLYFLASSGNPIVVSIALSSRQSSEKEKWLLFFKLVIQCFRLFISPLFQRPSYMGKFHIVIFHNKWIFRRPVNKFGIVDYPVSRSLALSTSTGMASLPCSSIWVRNISVYGLNPFEAKTIHLLLGDQACHEFSELKLLAALLHSLHPQALCTAGCPASAA